MGLPTRETNSSHASSSRGPAQKQMTSFKDRDEYRVGLGVFDILFLVRAVGEVGVGLMVSETSKATRQ
jgi:ABC-type tungstate transport system substrate-binding protein